METVVSSLKHQVYTGDFVIPQIPKARKRLTDQNRIFMINNRAKNLVFKYSSNQIQTSKYNIFNFMPKALIQEFMRVSNFYFLATAVLQSIPLISPLASFSAIGLKKNENQYFQDPQGLCYQFLQQEKQLRILGNILMILKQIPKEYYSITTQNFIIQTGVLQELEILLKYEAMKYLKFIPADMIILASSEDSGICYIETSNLDGESNLKTRSSIPQLQSFLTLKSLRELDGYVSCNLPDNNLNKFHGLCYVKDEIGPIPLGINNLLLRGTKLKNTEWVRGLIVYAGLDCKIIMNQGKVRNKSTHIERKMNYIIVAILILQAILCIITAVFSAGFIKNSYIDEYNQRWYLQLYKQEDVIEKATIIYFSFFLLLNTLVPISLIISLETLKQIQTLWLEYDDSMKNTNNKEEFRVLNSMIHEELGRIEYIFTDKTGTLTSNQMIFKGCCIRGIQYTDEDLKDILKSQLEGQLKQSLLDDQELNDFVSFWLSIVLCHEVIVDNSKQTIVYQGSSPDEVCLVQTAADIYDFRFIKRTQSSIFLQIDQEQQMEFQLLTKIDFTSERKRMSVVVRDMRTQKLTLYCKGADNIILKLLEPGMNNPQEQINLVKFSLKRFSKDGLRTLCFAYKNIDEKKYLLWLDHYQSLQIKAIKANSIEFQSIQTEIKEHEALLEKNLILLGSTALEDKLQDKVPETISDLHNAGIKVWMLTGDKLETAENIGYLCNLLTRRTKLFRIQADNIQDTKERLQRIYHKIEMLQNSSQKYKQMKERTLLQLQLNFLRDQSVANSQIRSVSKRISQNISQKSESQHKSPLDNFSQKKESIFENKQNKNEDIISVSEQRAKEYTSYSIIIEGESINHILSSVDNQNLFLEIVPLCRTFICCRLTPNQKAQIVSFVKQKIKAITLAIGDGGNDVNMIKEADIGIGILGREGNQAAAASDYYFSQFRYLRRLLFVHGRWNMVRTSYFVNFFFFKNILFTMQQFYFAFYSGFSAQTFWDDGYLLNFNTLVTAFAPLYYGAFDQDLSPHTSQFIDNVLPKVYNSYKHLFLFGYLSFTKWFFAGVFCSGVIFFSTNYMSVYEISIQDGYVDGLWKTSAMCYWASVLVVFIVIFFDSNQFSILTFFCYVVLSMLLYFPLFVLIWDKFESPIENMANDWLQSLRFWAMICLCVGQITIVRVLFRVWQWFEYPTIVDRVKLAAIEWNNLQEEKKKQKVKIEFKPNDRIEYIGSEDQMVIRKNSLEQQEDIIQDEADPNIIKNNDYHRNSKYFD